MVINQSSPFIIIPKIKYLVKSAPRIKYPSQISPRKIFVLLNKIYQRIKITPGHNTLLKCIRVLHMSTQIPIVDASSIK